MRIATLSLVLTISIAGCEASDESKPDTSTTAAATFPADVFTTTRPADVEDLSKVKPGAAVGENVVFLARVGGLVEPFISSRAIFVVTDPSLLSCELMGEKDHCPVPWDYCCETSAARSAGGATVRVLDAQGKPLRATAEHAGGLEAGKYVVIDGIVQDRNDEGLLVVDARKIWVGGKPNRSDIRAGSQ